MATGWEEWRGYFSRDKKKKPYNNSQIHKLSLKGSHFKKDSPKRSLESNQENLVGIYQSISKIRYLNQFSSMRSLCYLYVEQSYLWCIQEVLVPRNAVAHSKKLEKFIGPFSHSCRNKHTIKVLKGAPLCASEGKNMLAWSSFCCLHTILGLWLITPFYGRHLHTVFFSSMDAEPLSAFLM